MATASYQPRSQPAKAAAKQGAKPAGPATGASTAKPAAGPQRLSAAHLPAGEALCKALPGKSAQEYASAIDLAGNRPVTFALTGRAGANIGAAGGFAVTVQGDKVDVYSLSEVDLGLFAAGGLTVSVTYNSRPKPGVTTAVSAAGKIGGVGVSAEASLSASKDHCATGSVKGSAGNLQGGIKGGMDPRVMRAGGWWAPGNDVNEVIANNAKCAAAEPLQISGGAKGKTLSTGFDTGVRGELRGTVLLKTLSLKEIAQAPNLLAAALGGR